MPSAAHAILSPSKSFRWLKCPASRHAPEGPSHPSADAGTAVHRVTEDYLRSERRFKSKLQLELDALDAASQFVDDDKATQIAAVAPEYVSYIESLPPGDLHVEQKVFHPEIADFFGTIDCIKDCGDVVHVVDQKTGKWPFHPEQLLCYGVLVRSVLGDDGDDVSFIVAAVQPRTYDTPQIMRPSHRRLDGMEERIARAGQSEDVVPGDHCRFCSLRNAGCDAGATYAIQRGWGK